MSKVLSVLFSPVTYPKTAFLITPQLRYHYVVSFKYW